MNYELKLALKIVQDAGYKVVEPVPEKFIPFKGQIVSAWDGNEKKVTVHFMSMYGTRYKCASGINGEYFHIYQNCEPIHGLIQMEPYDPSYTGKANVQFDEGSILFFDNSQQASLNVYVNARGWPVFFQKLGE